MRLRQASREMRVMSCASMMIEPELRSRQRRSVAMREDFPLMMEVSGAHVKMERKGVHTFHCGRRWLL